MNVNDLELYLQTRISASSSDYELLLYTKAIQVLKSGGVFTANTASDLPSASQNEGKLYFIKGSDILAWSDGVDWKDINGKSILTSVFTWGKNICGLLGDGTAVDKSSPVQENSGTLNWCIVSAGSSHISAIKTNGTLWGWGTNSHGMLGDNTVISKSYPVQEITSSTNWSKTTPGLCHTTAIKTDGSLWSWGANSDGRLGDLTVVSKSSPVREISSSTNWCQVSAGQQHTLAIKTDGTLWAWGGNFAGRLGDNTNVNKSSPVREATFSSNWCQASAGDHSVALRVDGSLWSWGSNVYGQLGTGNTTNSSIPVREASTSTNWSQANAGDRFSIGMKTTGAVFGWGRNTVGQLGTGNVTNRCIPWPEISGATNWCKVSTKEEHTIALKTDGTLWAWGCNVCGKLGDGTVANRCSPVREISSSTNWIDASSGVCFSLGIKAVS